jgi:hypothetical protein
MTAIGLTGSVWQMNPSLRFGADGDRSLPDVAGNGERAFGKGWRQGDDGNQNAVPAVISAAEHPTPSGFDRLRHRMAKAPPVAAIA